MKYRLIDAADAPSASKPVNKLRQAVTEMVLTLEEGKAAVITPEKDESVRGLKSTITRAGNREGRKVRVWDIDGKVYVRLADSGKRFSSVEN
jgi:hypothetical protein